MTRWLKSSLTVLVVLGLVATGRADVAVSAKFGTPGLGADLSVPVTDVLNARVGFAWLNYDYEEESTEDASGNWDKESIQAELKLQTLGAYLDWHPWSSGFRMTCGLVFNGNEVTYSAETGDEIELNGRDYVVSDLNGGIEFASVCPYLGIGYGNPFAGDGRWFFSFDLGVMYHGAPDLTLNVVAANPAEQGQLNIDAEIERQDLQEDMDPFVVYPVVAIGLTCKF